MATGRQKRTRGSAPDVTATTAEAVTTAPPKTRASSSPAYKKTRRQNKDLLAQEQPTGSEERKLTVEEDEINPKKCATPSPSSTAAAAAAVAIETKEDKREPAVDPTEPSAAGDNAKDNDTPMEHEKKAEEPSQNDEKSKDDDAAGYLPEIKKISPVIFRDATTTLQGTLATMNAKAMMHAHISCDDLDMVYKQFDMFINSHPTLAPAVHPMLKAINLAPPPQGDNAAAGGNGDKAGNITGIAANVSSMLANLENSVVAAAGGDAGGGGGKQDDGYVHGADNAQQQQAPTQTIPTLKSHWDASSLLHLHPALASALSDQLKNDKNKKSNIAADWGRGANAATTMTTTTTTQGGGGAETTVLQEKIRRAIVAAQAGYTHNNDNNDNSGAAATYNPKMSSELDSHLNFYNQNHQGQTQTPLASGSPAPLQQRSYYQPSAADSAAIAAATAAALAGQSRAGVDKTPALELLKALNNLNYTGEAPSMINNNTNIAAFVHDRMQYNPIDSHTAPSYGYTAPAAYGDTDEDDYREDDSDGYGYAELEMDRNRSPTPTINPNTNRPLRRVVVQKAADELAASALVSLGAAAEATGKGKAPPASKGNKFNRNGFKKTAPSRYNTERRYDDYPHYSDGAGDATGGGINTGGNLKRKSPSKASGGGGGILPPVAGPSSAPKNGPTPQQTGGVSDIDVTEKVQLLMLMAQNLGGMQNPSKNQTNTEHDGGGGGGAGAGDVVVGVRSRAASQGAEGKALT